MDNKALYSKAMQYQRVAVKNTFSLLSILQDHGERLFKKSLEQNPWLPEKSKKACHCLADTCFDSSRLFEKIINRNFDDLEKFYRSGEKQQKKQTQSKRTDVSKSSQSKEKSPGNRSKSGTGASPSAKGATQKKKTKAVKPSKDELPQPKLIQPPTAEQPSVVMSTAVVDPTPADKDTKKEKPQGGNMPQPPSLSDKTQ
jgi:hypothetical protein